MASQEGATEAANDRHVCQVKLNAKDSKALHATLASFQQKLAAKGDMTVIKKDFDPSGTSCTVTLQASKKVSSTEWAATSVKLLQKINALIYEAQLSTDALVEVVGVLWLIDSLCRDACCLLLAEPPPNLKQHLDPTVLDAVHSGVGGGTLAKAQGRFNPDSWRAGLAMLAGGLPGAASRVHALLNPSRLRPLPREARKEIKRHTAAINTLTKQINTLANAAIKLLVICQLLQKYLKPKLEGDEETRVKELKRAVRKTRHLTSELAVHTLDVHTAVEGVRQAALPCPRCGQLLGHKDEGAAGVDLSRRLSGQDGDEHSGMFLTPRSHYSSRSGGSRDASVSFEDMTASSRTPPFLTWSELDTDDDDDDVDDEVALQLLKRGSVEVSPSEPT
mmetsp:Transcript_56809/g.133777  ORF Transcript_56809/g.133777 Transcript_56809/m.133777 type:complete len:391 (-) Transcript_56809:931-2103(-)